MTKKAETKETKKSTKAKKKEETEEAQEEAKETENVKETWAKQETEKKSLAQKLAEVMLEVRYVQKSGNNAFQKYTYATERDITEKIRIALAERSVILVPNLTGYSTRELETKKNGKVTIYTVDMEYTFMDGESGETLVFNITGEGQDQMEKGIYKAYTGAQKYALMKFFMIPTGDEPEEDNSDIEVTGSKPGARTQRNQPQSLSKLQEIKSLIGQIAVNEEQKAQLKGVIEKKMGISFQSYQELKPQQQLQVVKMLSAIRDQRKSG